MIYKSADFIATVTYLSNEEGGRKALAYSGYRPMIKFEGREFFTSGMQIFIGQDCIKPGETAKAEITIASVDAFHNYLYEGIKFSFWEGSHLIGNGVINEIFNKDIERKKI